MALKTRMEISDQMRKSSSQLRIIPITVNNVRTKSIEKTETSASHHSGNNLTDRAAQGTEQGTRKRFFN